MHTLCIQAEAKNISKHKIPFLYQMNLLRDFNETVHTGSSTRAGLGASRGYKQNPTIGQAAQKAE